LFGEYGTRASRLLNEIRRASMQTR